MGVWSVGMTAEKDEQRVGLCATCEHSRVIESARGSRFWMCRLSETDARFRKYPPLPVLRCSGYRKTGLQERKD